MSTPSNPPSKDKPVIRIDQGIQDIFDAMSAFMGTTYNTSTASVVIDGMSTTQTFACTDPQGNRQTYTTYALGNKVTVQPAGIALQAGQSQQFTASVTDPGGNPIAGATFVWTLSTGALGTVDSTGLYTAPASLTAASLEQLTATVQGSFSSAMVTISLQTNLGR